MTEHDLKTWPDYFSHLLDGSKTFEYRRNDRGFREGDILRLREWEPLAFEGGTPTMGRYTGREIKRRITYTLWAGADFVVMALGVDGGASGDARGVSEPSKPSNNRSKSEPMIVPSAEQLVADLRELEDAAERDQPLTATDWIADVLRRTLTLLDTLSQELERLKQENHMLLTRSGKPDGDRDFSIHAATDRGQS